MGYDKIGGKKLMGLIIDLNTSSFIFPVIIYIGYPKPVMSLGYVNCLILRSGSCIVESCGDAIFLSF